MRNDERPLSNRSLEAAAQASSNKPVGGSTTPRLRVALNPAPAHPRSMVHEPDAPFTQSELVWVDGQDCATTGPGATWMVYTDYTDYTDGSVIQRDGRGVGAFAGTFTQRPDTPIDFRGRVVEHPMSSTRMEAMAITPRSTPPEIHTDSMAAVQMMCHVAAPAPSRELNNSPDAFLWLHIRQWMQSRIGRCSRPGT